MELTFMNADGVSMTFRQTAPFFLNKLDGTGTISNKNTTFTAPDQDGAFFVGATRDMRSIIVEGTIVAANSDETYAHRRTLLRLFTPKQPGTLFFRDRKISCVVDSVKLISSVRERVPNFLINLLCPSPYFEALDTVREELAQWVSLFHFQLEIPPFGIEFGVRQPSQIITLINAGDVPCGCEIIFSALGTVINPELRNLDTGEYIRISKTMVAGESVHVYTHFAGKRVVSQIGSSESNAFSMLDVGSSFIQLSVGTNLLRYDADDGLDLLEVAVVYAALFGGV
jgi:hypothetical protein